MEKEFDFDLFVIGAGSGGVRACRVAASLGASVAVAEERYFGGTCVNVGCVPKKLFSYAAHYRDDIEDSAGFGWTVSDVAFNWQTLRQNKDNEINRLNGIYQSILDNNNVTIFEARARISGPNELQIDDKTVTAKHILIATGGWPWKPDYEGSELTISSNEVFHLEELPDSILVVGGGYIAVEFASIFTRLGVDTTLMYRGDRLLRGFDEEIRHFITAEIAGSLKLVLDNDVEKILRQDKGLSVYLKDNTVLEVDQVLSATGRRPMTDDLGLENVAVTRTTNGAIEVDEDFMTGEPGIYAVGDVINRMALTPVALAEGQIVARSLFAGQSRAMKYENIPTAVFCHPNLATVGLSEEKALAEGFSVDIYTATVKQLKHTLSGRQEQSMLKLVVDQSTDRVLGLHMVGPDAGELVQGFAVAINCGATKADFDNTIGIHPSLAEEFVTMRTARKTHSL